MTQLDPLDVAVLAYDQLHTFEFGITTEVFGQPRLDLRTPWYRFTVCAVSGRSVKAAGGVAVHVGAGLRRLARAGTIVIPGWDDLNRPPPAPLLRALRLAHARGARIVSICTGAYVVAAAGLLDGLRATTHWMHAAHFAQRFPQVKLDPRVLFVDEGSIITSAGSAAGIDVCLHVLRQDFGAEVANSVARRMVTSPVREGGQAQFVQLQTAAPGPGAFAQLLDWMTAHLDQPLGVARLAQRARMSPRTFARRFLDATGETPHRWLCRQRVRVAQQLLETTDRDIERIAADVGMGSAQNLRHHFAEWLTVSPTEHRRRFRQARAQP